MIFNTQKKINCDDGTTIIRRKVFVNEKNHCCIQYQGANWFAISNKKRLLLKNLDENELYKIKKEINK